MQGVLCAIDELKKLNLQISEKALADGIRQAAKTTGLQGRCQLLAKSPLTIADIAHNKAGIVSIVKHVNHFLLKDAQLHVVFGMVNDKDVRGVIRLLPKNATYYFCQPNQPRGMDVKILVAAAKEFRLRGKAYNTVKEAFLAAKKNASKDDVILVTGSNFVVCEVL